jgi:hypothetical protein
MDASVQIAASARKLAGSRVFKKRLPKEFGGGRINVTARSDIRLLLPGLQPKGSLQLHRRVLYFAKLLLPEVITDE